MQLRGKVLQIKEVETFSEKFSKQVIIVEQEGVKYDAAVPLELINDNIKSVGLKIAVGEVHTFNINISGREWKDKYFVSLRAWSLQEESVQATPTMQDKAGLPF
tara:strand:- start:2276 stop:2587 length:312 start_codon:yes stop_codon:yes gene_type:complete